MELRLYLYCIRTGILMPVGMAASAAIASWPKGRPIHMLNFEAKSFQKNFVSIASDANGGWVQVKSVLCVNEKSLVYDDGFLTGKAVRRRFRCLQNRQRGVSNEAEVEEG